MPSQPLKPWFVNDTMRTAFSYIHVASLGSDGGMSLSKQATISTPNKEAGARQLAVDAVWTQDRVEENRFINRVRERIAIWRQANYAGITNSARAFVEYWTNFDLALPLQARRRNVF